jgi:hypothetical protein
LPSNVLFITAWVKYYSTFELSNKKHTETASKKFNLVHFNHKNQIEKKILLTEVLAECKKYDKKAFSYGYYSNKINYISIHVFIFL